MKISVIIVSFNTCNILHNCIDALLKNSIPFNLEIFVVDNNSSDNSKEMVKKHFKQIILIENSINNGFAAANNQAYQKATGDYIVLLNPDAYVKPGAIGNAIKFMESHPDCGLCGGRLVNSNEVLDPSARRFPNSLYKFFTISGLSDNYSSSRFFGRGDFKYFDHKSIKEVDWVPGTFSICRRKTLNQLGLFDERFYMYFEETDLCLRIKRTGWKIYFIPQAEVTHLGGACSKTRKDLKFDSSGSQVLKFRMRSEYIYFRKNYGILSVLSNAGVEVGWHLLRYLANIRSADKDSEFKKGASKGIIKHSFRALIDTKFGKICPAIPW